MGFEPQTLGLSTYFVPSPLNIPSPFETLCSGLKDVPQILCLLPHLEAEPNPLLLGWAGLDDFLLKIFFLNFFFLKFQLIYSVVTIPAIQQSYSVMHTSI